MTAINPIVQIVKQLSQHYTACTWRSLGYSSKEVSEYAPLSPMEFCLQIYKTYIYSDVSETFACINAE